MASFVPPAPPAESGAALREPDPDRRGRRGSDDLRKDHPARLGRKDRPGGKRAIFSATKPRKTWPLPARAIILPVLAEKIALAGRGQALRGLIAGVL